MLNKKNQKQCSSHGSAEYVYRLLLTQILDGTLEPGSRLATEHDLANQHGVARSTLRRALCRLRTDKLIVSRQGDGSYVAGLAPDEQRSFIIEPFCKFDDIFEVRRTLDGLAAAHAALAQNEALIRDMEQALDVMRAEINDDTVDVINLRRADIDFHIAIADCSPNVLLRDLIETLASAIGPYWLIWMKMGFKQKKEIAKDTLREHDLILAAIKAGNPIAAETAMRNHFQTHFERSRKLFGAQFAATENTEIRTG